MAAEVIYDPEFWPPYDVKIELDANSGDNLNFIIHELLHVMFSPLLAGFMDETLEEVGIVAWDAYMTDYVRKSKKREQRWRDLIDKKIAEHLDTRPTIPHEERVER